MGPNSAVVGVAVGEIYGMIDAVILITKEPDKILSGSFVIMSIAYLFTKRKLLK